MITAGCSAARLRLRHDAALMCPTWRSGCISDMTGSVSDMTPAHIDADPSHSSRLSTGGQQSSAYQHVIASCLRSTASAQPTVVVVRALASESMSDSSSEGRGGKDAQYFGVCIVALQSGLSTGRMLRGVSAGLKRTFSFLLWWPLHVLLDWWRPDRRRLDFTSSRRSGCCQRSRQFTQSVTSVHLSCCLPSCSMIGRIRAAGRREK